MTGVMAVANAPPVNCAGPDLNTGVKSPLLRKMTYSFKEIFLTLQGEGAQSGRVAVFARFAGCNLWSGRERDRKGALCDFCDTDFVGIDGENGGKFQSASDVLAALNKVWGDIDPSRKMVVFTGGEPLLQLDKPLIDKLKSDGFYIAIETNGTILAPDDIDWICVSPKGNNALVQTFGHELKLIWPQKGIDPSQFEKLAFQNYYLQPMDGLNDNGLLRADNTQIVIDYCLSHPKWAMSTQTHKIVGLK